MNLLTIVANQVTSSNARDTWTDLAVGTHFKNAGALIKISLDSLLKQHPRQETIFLNNQPFQNPRPVEVDQFQTQTSFTETLQLIALPLKLKSIKKYQLSKAKIKI